jgi:hypothetical protein
MNRALICGAAVLAVIVTSNPAAAACKPRDLRGTWDLYVAGSLVEGGFEESGDPLDPGEPGLPFTKRCEVFATGNGGFRRTSSACGGEPVLAFDFRLAGCELHEDARILFVPPGTPIPIDGFPDDFFEGGGPDPLVCGPFATMTKDRQAIHGVVGCSDGSGSFSMVRR